MIELDHFILKIHISYLGASGFLGDKVPNWFTVCLGQDVRKRYLDKDWW
jgi:hypothetical protein